MKSIGFPMMHKEINEKRDFLPQFFNMLSKENIDFYLEDGYGSGMNFTHEDYTKMNNKIRFVSNKECYEKDIVVVLRSPEFNEIDYMKRGSILVSMLHYPTRITRVNKLKSKGIIGISMDSLKNDFLERIVVNYTGTSGNGMELAFRELEKDMHDFNSKDRGIIKVTILGMGMVGLTAAKIAGKYGNSEINEKMKKMGMKGVLVRMLPRNLTSDNSELLKMIRSTDILVDASTRDDPTKYIIKNSLIDEMKEHAIILDLTADPYLTDINPIQVKAIEGIPTGTLDKPVICKNDEEAYNTIPSSVCKKNRRTVVSCNAWPGIKPINCMEVYGKQILPIIKCIGRNNDTFFSEESDDFFVRAIYRATIDFYEKFEKAM